MQNQRKLRLEEEVAEHFTYYLFKKGHFVGGYLLNKKELKDEFIKNYIPAFPVRMKPYLLLISLVRTKCVERRKKKTDETVVTFKAATVKKIVQVYEKAKQKAPRQENRGQDVQIPPPDKSVTDPVVKLFVSQQHALRGKIKKSPGATSRECKICAVSFASVAEYEAHVRVESHYIKEMYRINRKSLSGNHKIVISSRLENASGRIILRDGVEGSVPIEITNAGDGHLHLMKIYTVYDLNEVVGRWPTLPLKLKPGASISISLDYIFRDPGTYIYPLVFRLSSGSANKSSYVAKDMIFQKFGLQEDFLDDLLPSTPFKWPTKPVQLHSDVPIVYGEPLPLLPSSLITVNKLRPYEPPESLRHVINHGFKPFANMTPTVAQKLKEVRSLLELDAVTRSKTLLKKENYCKFFRLLLYFEEHQMENNIHMYDCDDQVMEIEKSNKKLLKLKVPGLSENRPSVLRGDSVFVMIQGNESVKYEGKVHAVQEEHVLLAFHKSLLNKFVQGMKFHVEYQFNRWVLRCQHRALEMVNNHNVSSLMFPERHAAVPVSYVTITSWFNNQLKTNPQQQQAVRNILCGTSYPAPYLIFGPPGTGKTVTVVEAITQLYHLTTTGRHILVCAPSNSAANEITKRLVSSQQGFVPDSHILRMFAASYKPSAIPEELKKCSNYRDREFFYPSKEEIMKYPIVVVTLASAGRLVNGAIPPGHFSHLFIDESGQAIEPETLIPIVGLFTSREDKGKLHGQLVLAGDPKQLGPVLHSRIAVQFGLNTSLLERLMDQHDLYKKNEQKQYNPAVLTKLVQNFRSHKTILTLPNKMFYDKELEACGDTDLTSLACNWSGLPKKGFPMIFHGVKGKDDRESNSPSYFNVQEIAVVVQYVQRLLEDRLSGRKLQHKDIGIITPYRKQVEKMKKAFKKKKLDKITVGSVEEFQGQERTVIIISTVRSNMELLDEDYKFRLGFLKNPKRFNVAVTRAKALLIVVGDPDILQCDVHWRELLTFCKDNGGYVGCKLKLKPMPTPVEILSQVLSSLRINTPEDGNTAEETRWRGDI